ncbi:MULTISPECIES: AraC family transcriptional regulator [unclassified Undibacterium]|uniref:AraC family transcriptional regulator n=1 Tax=unclassified Undibacterium TaxID=2630295 RepID=UPI002AC8CF96|nr:MULTISPECIES: AraC family transcriptional regulator [unclassified Undibacterium]MEB0137654.1 AraC family transcriptional regulator [Undibacterium sp. CCC2.1]MEB0174280.1 AraC family transcriptional regulator [Undibacterium sp. CCC1.1]MEB0177396.1 AraC family transcriptional regulator [Undibacterium sp. CCC3.4]MEB0215489.1 AraC family transcriptional regulator [Undibacterium sp. 5I2]WPX42230.1 AraC family transcriptional regulator [Undibacterium sp. CCC3.4]
MHTDPLAPLLTHFKAQARLFFSGNLCHGADFGEELGTGFLHLLRAGSAKLSDASGYSETFSEPTLIFYSRPVQHRLQTDPIVGADLVCASMRFEHKAFNPISFALPARFQRPISAFPGADTLIELLFHEAFSEKPGRQDVLDRLFEVLLIDVLRVAMAEQDKEPGLFRSLQHPQLGKALTAIHTDPAKQWSLDTLAQLAGMSRSSFASSFKTEVGDTPGNYLTRWRITLAQALIRDGVSLKLVAERVGYESQAGFLKAFKMVIGETPAIWRNADLN